ncbi:MAG: hypothetical protein V3V44_02510, partial [Anaerolineales bacterium]
SSRHSPFGPCCAIRPDSTRFGRKRRSAERPVEAALAGVVEREGWEMLAWKSTRNSRECRGEMVSPKIWPVVVLVTECVLERQCYADL